MTVQAHFLQVQEAECRCLTWPGPVTYQCLIFVRYYYAKNHCQLNIFFFSFFTEAVTRICIS